MSKFNTLYESIVLKDGETTKNNLDEIAEMLLKNGYVLSPRSDEDEKIYSKDYEPDPKYKNLVWVDVHSTNITVDLREDGYLCYLAMFDCDKIPTTTALLRRINQKADHLYKSQQQDPQGPEYFTKEERQKEGLNWPIKMKKNEYYSMIKNIEELIKSGNLIDGAKAVREARGKCGLCNKLQSLQSRIERIRILGK